MQSSIMYDVPFNCRVFPIILFRTNKRIYSTFSLSLCVVDNERRACNGSRVVAHPKEQQHNPVNNNNNDTIK